MSYQVSSIALRQARTLRRNQNSVRVAVAKPGLGPISNTLVLALILCVMGLLYLTQITKMSAFGYQVGGLNREKQELIEANQTLSVEAARLQALERIRTSEVAKNLSTPASTTFVDAQ